MSQDQKEADKKIEVDAHALYELLSAVVGPDHLIRELQATQMLDSLGFGSTIHPHPINVLVKQWNEYVVGQTPSGSGKPFNLIDADPTCPPGGKD